MNLSRMTMPEFERLLTRTRTAVLPVGSTEEHGLHLPLDTDTMQAVHTATLAAEQAAFFLCPPLHYGYCRSTSQHPGTLSISPEALRRIVFDIGAGLYSHGVRGLIIASGHAGGIHMSALDETAEALLEAFDELEVAVFCEYHWAGELAAAAGVETPNDGHAGEIETSRILALDPSLVKGTSPEEYPDFPAPFVARDKRAHWPGGVWGNPAKASAEKGAALYELGAKKLAELVVEMERRVADRAGAARDRG